MDFASVRGRAEALAAPVVDRVQSIRIDPPAVPLSRVLIAVVVGIALAAGWAWWIKRERDAWWRERIAASSSSVRAAIAKGGEVATATDADIIKGLQDAEAQRERAERGLREALERKPEAGRDECRVPARCVTGSVR